MNEQERKDLIKQLYENEDAYWIAPSQGFIADWFLLYWELHNKVLVALGEEAYDTPLEERRRYEEEKRTKA